MWIHALMTLVATCSAATTDPPPCAWAERSPQPAVAQPAAAGASSDPANDDAKAVAAFRERVGDYASLRRKLERGAPERPEKATPEEITRHQQALAGAIREARASARPGDLFTRDVQEVFRKLLARVFKKPDGGRNARAAVTEEDTSGAALGINRRYPDGVPLSTMPPDVLTTLPPLPEPLQYHFVGRTLILLDADAQLIVDFMPRAMP